MPISLSRIAVGKVEPAKERGDRGHGVLGHGIAVGAWPVHHPDPLGISGRHIDIIHADPMAGDHLQPLCPFKYLLRIACIAHDDPIRPGDLLFQGRDVCGYAHLQLIASVGQISLPAFRDILRDQDPIHPPASFLSGSFLSGSFLSSPSLLCPFLSDPLLPAC